MKMAVRNYPSWRSCVSPYVLIVKPAMNELNIQGANVRLKCETDRYKTSDAKSQRSIGSVTVRRLFYIPILVAACSSGIVQYKQPQGTDGTLGAPLNAGAIDTMAVLIGAGDIVHRRSPGDELTAQIVDSLLQSETTPVWVFTLGDNVYERGTAEDFVVYDSTWGRFKTITRPIPGNHEYKNGFLWFLFGGHANPYFNYFTAFPGQAGEAGKGWYTYRHGQWDVYALNPGTKRRIDRGSEQWNWLTQELERDRSECAVVYSHYPRFSAGKHGDNDRQRELWELLDVHGVDVLITGHDHNYQRFHPQTADGVRDSAGIRQFIVGSGGTYLHTHDGETSGSLARKNAEHFGVLKLALRPDRYEWAFVTPEGVWDTGQSECQNTLGQGENR